MTMPSGVLGKAVYNRIFLTANFLVGFSGLLENSLYCPFLKYRALKARSKTLAHFRHFKL
jgi:hypothetical protein